jgi:hypothetical protein
MSSNENPNAAPENTAMPEDTPSTGSLLTVQPPAHNPAENIPSDQYAAVNVASPDDAQPMTQVQIQREGGFGCAVASVAALFVFGVVLLGALFLPPFNLLDRVLNSGYTMLTAQQNTLAVQGLQFTADATQLNGEFGIRVASVGLSDFTTGNARAGDWIPNALSAVPPFLALQSAVYTFDTVGTAPKSLQITLDLPPTVSNTDILDVYVWDAALSRWVFAPSIKRANSIITTLERVPLRVAVFQAAPTTQPIVFTVIDTQRLTPEVAQLSTIIAPAGLIPTRQGTLVGSLAPGFELNAPYRTMPIVRNFTDPRALDPDTVTAILSDATLRAEHTRQLVSVAMNGGFAGVFVDYRGLPAAQRANFTVFVEGLGRELTRNGLLLGVVVPSATINIDQWETGAYDWRAIGASADYVQITLPLNPAVYKPGDNQPIEAMLRWAVNEVSRYKLLLGLSALSIRQVGEDFSTIGYDEALASLGSIKVDAPLTATGTVNPGAEIRASLDGLAASAGLDVDIQSPYIDYQGRETRMWLTTGDALRFRMDRTLLFALGGVGFADLLDSGVGRGVLPNILNYKVGVPAAPSRSELALRWRINGTSGVIGETTTALGETLVATVIAPDGNYTVNVDVIASGEEIARDGAALAVFAPTPTPTPLPTSTPTPTPTATFTPAPIIATARPAVSAPSGGGGGVVAPVAGSIVASGFEYGGHVASSGTGATDAMRRAGMTWMKIQVRYNRGADPSPVSTDIANARSRGFKILLGVVGSPQEVSQGGSYISEYANYVGGLAAMGPDAIEIWNEPNLDREWPTGQISGSFYVQLLQASYNAIKSRNGSVLVISGAPAPTGAETEFPGRVMNDDNWLREVVQAGGLNYMDCLGAHYNEGIVGPDQTSGDPRDNYYTRYYFGILNTYWNLIGGAKPICFTELGYLTPEGFPPLDPFFGWAQNVTVAQQASWLARAAALSSQSGKVRLMIIWNIDFTRYDTDPMAGFAIIRPGGGCPACDALAGSR